MAGSRRTIAPSVAAAVMAATAAVCGCTLLSPPADRTATPSSPQTQAAAGHAATTSSPGPNQPDAPADQSQRRALGSSDMPDLRAMHEVIAEIQEVGVLDPAAQEELLENLKQTDPRLWPLVAQQVRADLAWRRRVDQGEIVGAAAEVSLGGRSPYHPPRADRNAVQRADGETDGIQSLARSFRTGGGFPPDSRRLPGPDAAAAPLEAPRGGSRGRDDPNPSDSLASLPPPDRRVEDGATGEVIVASCESESAERWQAHLKKAIELLESEVARSPGSDREFAEHARLRMLYLVGDRRDEALRPIPSMAPAMQEFWSKQLYGLATLTDPELISESGRRRAQAKQHLDAALGKLGESCPLVVRNLAFATEIELFGRYKPFEKYEFEPGQQVLLYAELENFKIKETPRGFHTATRSSYQIFDSSGRRVAEHEFSPSEEYCPNPRRDYFVGYDLTLPRRIFPGKHVLQLTVADLNSEKIGQSLIEFTVKSPDD